ncbi:MAG: hypothetical protein ACE3JK_05875 [Sporolactobacillus sp.]
MKKIFVLSSLIIAVSLLTGYQNASAKSSDSSNNNNHTIVLTKHSEETDLNVLYDRAVHGITDSSIKTKLPSPTVNVQRVLNNNNYTDPSNLRASSADFKTKTYSTA